MLQTLACMDHKGNQKFHKNGNGNIQGKRHCFFKTSSVFSPVRWWGKKADERPWPDHSELYIQQQTTDHGRTSNRSFSSNIWNWLAGCPMSNALFCFSCLLFQSPGTEMFWTTSGVTDLKHMHANLKSMRTVEVTWILAWRYIFLEG